MKKLIILPLIIFITLDCKARNKAEKIVQHIDIPKIIEAVLNKGTTELSNYNIPLKKILDSLKIVSTDIHIYISKNDFTLSVMKDSFVIKSYPVVLGFNEKDDKLRQGDGCTPEGDFYIVDKYPPASWSKFIWINYPTADSWKKHNAAKASGEIQTS